MPWIYVFTSLLASQASRGVTLLVLKAWQSRKSSSGNGLTPPATITRSDSNAATISTDSTDSRIDDSSLLPKKEANFNTSTLQYGSHPIEIIVALVGIIFIQLWHHYLPHADIFVPALGIVFYLLEILEETMGETNGPSPCWYLCSRIRDFVSGTGYAGTSVALGIVFLSLALWFWKEIVGEPIR